MELKTQSFYNIKNKPMYDKETMDILNYVLIKNGKHPLSRSYKLNIKEIGCNARCSICEDWQKRGDIKKIRIALYEAFKNVVSDTVKYKHIQILGGEPILIFDDIVRIVEIGTKNDMTFDFPTNGSLLTYKKIDRLIRAGLDNFTFSVDFPNNTHDSWRGLSGGFRKIMDFTKYIQERGLSVQWNTVVGKFNFNEIIDFQELYLLIRPNTHNFILIEDNGGKSRENFLEDKQIVQANRILSLFENDYEDIEIIRNGFTRANSLGSGGDDRCFIPIKTVTYMIDESGYKIYPCYYDIDKEINLNEFTIEAITRGCSKCHSSCKENYNIYFLELIKKYKLSNK